MPNSHHRGRYHRGTSTFGAGRRVKLDRNARARFKWFVRADCQRNKLSHAGEKIGLALVDMLGETGQLDPSYATLGERTRTDVSTVGRCLARLRELGRVTWERRLRRDADTGWRCEQTSNAYVLHADACDTQNAGEAPFVSKVRKKAGLTGARTSRPDPDRGILTPLGDWRAERDRQLRALGFANMIPD